MAKPPAGSSLLFGALADSGRIKQRKNGSYRMVLDGVDEINWFTDRPFRSEGLWKPQKLTRQWDSLFETSEPNAQASFKVGEKRELMTFEMFEPKFNNKKQRLSFKIDAGIINNRESDLVTGLKGKALDEVTLFIDDAMLEASLLLEASSPPISWVEKVVIAMIKNPPWLWPEDWDLSGADLTDADLARSDLTGANLTNATLLGTKLPGANLTKADLTGANLTKADLSGGATLNNANLTGANLTGANLYRANLMFAELNGADLTNANTNGVMVTGAIWGNTTCPDGTNSNDPGNATCRL